LGCDALCCRLVGRLCILRLPLAGVVKPRRIILALAITLKNGRHIFTSRFTSILFLFARASKTSQRVLPDREPSQASPSAFRPFYIHDNQFPISSPIPPPQSRNPCFGEDCRLSAMVKREQGASRVTSYPAVE